MFKAFLAFSSWISAAAIFCLFWGFLIEPTLLKVRYHDVEIESWTEAPLRIVFISDIHMAGAHISSDRVSHIVDRVNELDPDIVLIGGDFIDGHTPRSQTSNSFNSEVDIGFTKLTNLQAKLGVYAVIGNHDVWYDVDVVRNALSQSGIKLLENEAVNIERNICVVGYQDETTQSPNRTASQNCNKDTIFLSLMHSPDSLKYVDRSSFAFAGHTHGGQINIPLIGRRITSTRLGEKYAYGLQDYQGIPVYITSGIGTSILPARFRSAPEIAVIILK